MSDDTPEVSTAPVAPVKPRRASRRVAEVETPEFEDLLIATDDPADYELIRLHTSEEIAPGGHPFGVNGRFFILRGDKWYKVPAWLLSSIDNCITEKPQRDEFDRFIGTRPMKRFPYETFRG